MGLVEQIVPYDMTHNAEPEAVDLLLEVERIDMLEAHADDKNYARTCLYLLGCHAYLPEPEDSAVVRTAFNIYSKAGKHSDALRMALKLGSRELAEQAFANCAEPFYKKQLAYILGRHGLSLNLEDGPAAVEDEELREQLQAIISNTKLSEQYLSLARDLDVMEAKVPEDVYKMHLVEGRAPTGPAVDSARANLAATFVNAFVNAGFGQDKLVTAVSEDEKVHWIFKNKDHGKMSATASLGTVLLWDVEGGLPQIDRFLYSTDNQVVAGALLAVGIVNCGVQDEVDPALALLSDYVSKDDPQTRIGAILGLGIAYAGREKEEVAELLLPLIMDTDLSMEVGGRGGTPLQLLACCSPWFWDTFVAPRLKLSHTSAAKPPSQTFLLPQVSSIAALSLGLIYQGTANGDAVEAVLQALMLRGEADLTQPGGRLMCLALGLLFLHRQGAVDATLEVAKTLDERVSRFLQVVLDVCAYAGTGDVLKVQQLLALCGEHIETEEATAWKTLHQSVAVLGLGLLAMSEELGGQMAHRALEHLLQYGEPAVRRAVPLALALLNVSSPDMTVMDTLSRLSHDTDTDVAMNAVLALGFIGAGTNNARLAGILRNLSSYYYKEPTLLFLVRIAQGLVHMGKGLLTLNPYHSDHTLLNGTALAGILAVLLAGGLDMKATLAGKQHYLLYCLTPAMKPRMLMTVDESGAMLPVPVRVGQAVDTVAQAGRPKTITGFQTHTTPVLLSVGERAELGTEKYIPASGTLEGVVILRENPDYVEMHE
jgi:26S proteasome regulatory subunit N1